MADVLAVVECAAKAMHIASLGEAPRHVHNIAELLRHQPAPVRSEFTALAGSDVDLATLHMWRQGFTYVADRPGLPTERALRAHGAAALAIASAVVARTQHMGIAADELDRWNGRIQHCHAVLDGPIRHRHTPSRGADS
ncbi:hypothetical protein [Candidatus Poriferisodalis sp.]|uniref:hypothetical protein n=1 Tax=Candidatus Poriferisodalis sp. TaxID=3101277 RepID=UPI003B024413